MKAFFPGLLYKAFSATDYGAYSMIQVYSAARNAEAAYGRVSSIFSSAYGHYYLQESQVHLKMYSVYDYILGLDYSKLSKRQVKRVFPWGHDFESSAKKLSDDKFIAILSKLPDEHYFYIPVERMNLIDCEELTDRQITQLFFGHKDIPEKLKVLKTNELTFIVKKLSKEQLQYVPLPSIPHLKCEDLEVGILKGLFLAPFKDNDNREKLSLLMPDQFKIVFDKIFNDVKNYNDVKLKQLCDCLPSKYVNQVDFKNNPNLIEKIFPIIPTFNVSTGQLHIDDPERKERWISHLDNLDADNLNFVCNCHSVVAIYQLVPPQKFNDLAFEALNQEQLRHLLITIMSQLNSDINTLYNHLCNQKRRDLYAVISKFYPNLKDQFEFLNVHPMTKEYCRILGVSQDNLTETGVKKAYRSLFHLHPDKVIQDDNGSWENYDQRLKKAKEHFSKIQNAYENLINIIK